MSVHAKAGKPAPKEILVDPDQLLEAYYEREPDPTQPAEQVSFGTSGHRGTSLSSSFTDLHIAAITQAICEYRVQQRIDGPIFIGKDTHCLSAPAERSALTVLAAHGISTLIQADDGYTPTPVISHAILSYNRDRSNGLADGIVITPSHNPPADGGFKYNSINGGPADVEATSWIQNRANQLLAEGRRAIKRTASFEEAMSAECIREKDFAEPYIADLKNVVDMDRIRESGVKLGADPLGGASVEYWKRIREAYGLNLVVVNERIDPTFSFMPLDHDGKIRMDCSSPHAMAGLLALKNSYDVAFGNDPDADRHGIVTAGAGLLNPNHYLAVAIRYLFSHRRHWPESAGVGKTLVSSSVIDRVASALGRPLIEVPVGFKWFVEGLFSGSLGFGGEESAGASFLRRDGTVWCTDKDGIILNLLAAEITAVTGKDPGVHASEIAQAFGQSYYHRLDQPIAPEKKALLKKLSAEQVKSTTLAGEPILSVLTTAPGNGAEIGGIKVVSANGWFAARPSGTEDIYKIYAESFKSVDHLREIFRAAGEIVDAALS